jgi:LL-diaminopimelate aminotransferase
VLTKIGLEVTVPKASLYIWAKVPEGYNSVEFTADLLDQAGVAVTPGVGYGRSGEGYVRLSLTIQDAALVKGLSKLSGWRNTRRLTLKK